MSIKAIKIVISALITLLLIGCTAKQQNRNERIDYTMFDTVTTITGYGNKLEFEKQADKICAELLRLNKLYDIYNNYDFNNLKSINDKAGISPVKVDDDIIQLLQFSVDMYEKTDGKVNIAFGSVLSIWHQYRTNGIDDPKNAALPPMQDLEDAARYADINKMIINAQDSTVYLSDPHMRLDVGAIAKGYAVEQVRLNALEIGFTRGIINVGGNVCVIGDKDGEAFNVGIQVENSKIEKTVKVSNKCVVTSGIYQRNYTVDGKIYHHIIDETTLMPSKRYTAVSIIATDSGIADALSTALFNMSYEQGIAVAEKFSNVGVLWVMNDKSEREYNFS